MPECFNCGKEIKYLVQRIYGSYQEWKLRIDKKGNPIYEPIRVVAETMVEYICPECKEVLFEDEKMALKFLKEQYE
jgi:predicted RNA-binding Zn-ribbon protein involved in translation (DUF1610 family)